jgi:hypothetical protein
MSMNTTTGNVAGRKVFQGYIAWRKDLRVWVINEGKSKAGERILKIMPGRIVGYAGWSGGSNAQYAYGNPIWVKASEVRGQR